MELRALLKGLKGGGQNHGENLLLVTPRFEGLDHAVL